MPLYEYECESCGRRFERIQKFSDPLAETCPHCGGKVHKMISSPAIQFKGSGWYITDYSKKGASEGGKNDQGDKSDKSDKNDKNDGAKTSDSPASDKPSTSTPDAKPAGSTSSGSTTTDAKSTNKS